MNTQKLPYIYQNIYPHTVEKNAIENNHSGYEKINEINYKNGISSKRLPINMEGFSEQEKCTAPQKSQCFITPMQSSTAYRKIFQTKEKKSEPMTSEQNGEREMPLLTKELDPDSKVNRLKKPAILNQRYQNVLRFPNYRQRKKFAFEKKLRRCGVELDGEATISNLRKILQPYIYQEIDNVLEKYVKVYFMKAFNNIRENINLTSENWSQTLKSSISKSIYKQYCEKAKVEPFNSLSIASDDFPYFQISQRITHKDNMIDVNNSTKSEIENSTGHTSDTNSHCSQYSIVGEKLEIDQYINIAEISSSSNQTIEYPYDNFNGHVDNSIPRKRNFEVVTQMFSDVPENSSKFNDNPCSNVKYSKIVYPTQSYTPDSYVSHTDNNSSSFIIQMPAQGNLETVRSKLINQPIIVIRKPKEQSSSAIESGLYLKSQNTMTTNNNSDHLYPHNYPY